LVWRPDFIPDGRAGAITQVFPLSFQAGFTRAFKLGCGQLTTSKLKFTTCKKLPQIRIKEVFKIDLSRSVTQQIL